MSQQRHNNSVTIAASQQQRHKCHNSVTTTASQRDFSCWNFWSARIIYECNNDTTALQRRVSQTALWRCSCQKCICKRFLLYQTFPSIPDVSFYTKRFLLHQTFPSIPNVSFYTKRFLLYQTFPSIPDVSFYTKRFLLYQTFPSIPNVSFYTRRFLLHQTFPSIPITHKCKILRCDTLVGRQWRLFK